MSDAQRNLVFGVALATGLCALFFVQSRSLWSIAAFPMLLGLSVMIADTWNPNQGRPENYVRPLIHPMAAICFALTVLALFVFTVRFLP